MSILTLSAYDPQWPRLYQREAPRVSRALGNVVAMEHVGSTSVPGLAGKPTIDIAAGVESLALDPDAQERMRLIGYAYGGDLGFPQHIFRKGDAVPWRFLIHVVEYDGGMWRDFLRFRDYLRTHPDEAERYATLKATLLRDRNDWYHGTDKEPFIRPILAGTGDESADSDHSPCL